MKKAFIIITLLAPILAASQQLSLEEAISTALKNNYDIRLARIDSANYTMNRSYANAAFLPRLNASSALAFSNNDQKQEFANGTLKERNNIRAANINTAVNLNWTLFDGLKMFASYQKLDELNKLGMQELRDRICNTISDVIKTYYLIVRQKQQMKATEEQMRLNEERVKQAEQKFSAGLTAKPELLQAQVDLNAQKAEKLKLIANIEQLKDQLNQLMAVMPGSRYEVTDSIPIDKSLQQEDIAEKAKALNPLLLSAKQNISIATLTLKERKAEKWPVINFNSAYNFIRTNNKAVVNDFTPLFNRNSGFNYGVSATIPLFNNYNNKRQIQEATLDLNYQQLSYQLQLSAMEIAIRKAFSDYQSLKQMLDLEEENIVLAKENTFIAAERFRLGVTGSMELRESQKSLEEAYNRLISTRYALKIAETDLLKLRGDLVK